MVDNRIEIHSPYDSDLINEIKSLEKARWETDKKCWSVPLTEHNEVRLRKLRGIKDETISDRVDKSYSRDLFSHQREGVEFILSRKSALLAFEMGLGKTLTTIEAIEQCVREGIVRWWLVAPKGAQKEWKRQLKNWDAAFVFEEITTYESLHKPMKQHSSPPQGVVFDESIKIKNPSAQRSQMAYELTRLIRECHTEHYIIALSGSPAPKDPTEWWHPMHCLKPGYIREGNIHSFRNRYAEITYAEGPYGRYPETIEWPDENLRALGRRLRHHVLVKSKRECLDLPDKIYERIELDSTPETLAQAALLVDACLTPLEAMMKLRQLSDGFQYTEGSDARWMGSPKEQAVKDLLDFYHTENGGNGRLVIYAHFHAVVDRLEDIAREQGWYPITITRSKWSNKDVLGIFDRSLYPTEYDTTNTVIIGNPASVHGISLQETRALVYYSNDFSTDSRIQSEDRRDRPGMDVRFGTRVVDLIHLPIDSYILEVIAGNKKLQDITLEEIKSWCS